MPHLKRPPVSREQDKKKQNVGTQRAKRREKQKKLKLTVPCLKIAQFNSDLTSLLGFPFTLSLTQRNLGYSWSLSYSAKP